MDRQLADLAAEGPSDRVADGRIDLARDLGDRDAVGDREIELDVERGAEVDVDPRLGETEARQQALVRPAANPVTP